jgi:thioredoxin reductase (NADPH)
MSDQQVRNAIVVGSGPSGYTAAIYLARAALEPLVFEGSVTAGGALMNTTDVENYPGFPDGVMGPQLMDDLRKQAERFGAELVTDDVVELDLHADHKVVKTSAATFYTTTVVLAMGSAYRNLDVPGESELSGRGVSWCATCDGFSFRDQDSVVVGGGDTAVEKATFLSRFARSVTMVHRRDTLRASKVMQQRAFSNGKIRFEWDNDVVEAVGADRLEGVRLRNCRTDEERLFPATGLFNRGRAGLRAGCSYPTGVHRRSLRDGHIRALRARSGHAEIVEPIQDPLILSRTTADLRLLSERATGIEPA